MDVGIGITEDWIRICDWHRVFVSLSKREIQLEYSQYTRTVNLADKNKQNQGIVCYKLHIYRSYEGLNRYHFGCARDHSLGIFNLLFYLFCGQLMDATWVR